MNATRRVAVLLLAAAVLAVACSTPSTPQQGATTPPSAAAQPGLAGPSPAQPGSGVTPPVTAPPTSEGTSLPLSPAPSPTHADEAGAAGKPPLPPPNSPAGDHLRPIPGSMATGEIATAEKIEGYKAVVRSLVKEGKPISSFFPKMAYVARRMNLKSTDAVADIGSGTGVFAIALLENKIPFAKCYSVDINQPSLDFHKFLLDTTALPGAEKVQTVLSKPTDVALQAASIDVAVLINAPFVMARVPDGGKASAEPAMVKLLTSLRAAMKPGARVYAFQSMTQAAPAGPDAPTNYAPATIAFTEAGFKLVSAQKTDFEADLHEIVFKKD